MLPVFSRLPALLILFSCFSASAQETTIPWRILPPKITNPDFKSPANPASTNWRPGTDKSLVLPLKDGLTLGTKYRARWGESLPTGSWTLDFTVSGRDEFDLTIVPDLGPDPCFLIRFKWPEEDLPVHKIRLFWDRDNHKMHGWANGSALYDGDLDTSDSRIEGHIQWAVTNYGNYGTRSLSLSHVRLRPGTPADLPKVDAPEPPGLAETGWRQASTAALSPEATQLLEQMTGTKENPLTRAYAMSALMIANRNPRQGLDNSQILAVETLTTNTLDDSDPKCDASAAALVLPVAIASMSPAQRKQESARITAWKSKFFEPFFKLVTSDMPSPVRAPVSGIEAVLARGGLLSPVRTIAAQPYGELRVPYFVSTDWISQLSASRPDAALAASAKLIRDSENGGFAWFLPQLREGSPEVYTDVITFQKCDSENAGIVNRSFPEPRPESAAKAAYRLAGIVPADSAYFLSLIKEPEFRADVLEQLAGLSRTFSPEIDKALAESIAAFKPGHRVDSPVPLIVRRATYNFRCGRPQVAKALLESAKFKIGKAEFSLFEDPWSIYRALRDMKDPSAGIWLAKSQAAAIARDKNASEIDSGLYFSATRLVVAELAKLGQYDAALNLARTLDEDNLPWNRSISIRSVINSLVPLDTPRALRMVQELSPEKREGATVGIALIKAPLDFDAAWKIMATVSPAARDASMLRLAPFAPPAYRDQIRPGIEKSIQAQVNRPNHMKYGLHERNIAGLENLPPDFLAALAPAFAGDHELLARDLFLSIGSATGAANDPVWLRLSVPEKTYGYELPWAAERLEDVLRGEANNREAGYFLPPVALTPAH